MRRAPSFLSALVLPVVLALACGPSVHDVGDDDVATTPTGSPTPTPLTPTQATYDGTIKPIEIAFACGSCHNGGVPVFRFNPSETNASNIEQWRKNHVCDSRISAYDPPAGKLLYYFCDSETAGKLPGHQGKNFSGAQCTTLYAWIREGQTASPPVCQ